MQAPDSLTTWLSHYPNRILTWIPRLFGKNDGPAPINHILWLFIYWALFTIFYLYITPLRANYELRERQKWTWWVRFSNMLFIWLLAAALYHMPTLKLLQEYEFDRPVSLFAPFFSVSALTLWSFEMISRALRRAKVNIRRSYTRTWPEMLHNSLIITILVMLPYLHCGERFMGRPVLTPSPTVVPESILAARAAQNVPISPIETPTSWAENAWSIFSRWSGGAAVDAALNATAAAARTKTVQEDLPITEELERETTNFVMRLYGAVVSRVAQLVWWIGGVLGVRAVSALSPELWCHFLLQSEDFWIHSLTLWVLAFSAMILNGIWEKITGIHGLLRRGHHKALEGYPGENIPEALPMVSWYRVVIFQTGYDLMLTLKVFLGRYDARSTQAALTTTMPAAALGRADLDALDEQLQDATSFAVEDGKRGIPRLIMPTPFVFDQHAHKDQLIVDFAADGGDGFNPSYQIARLLAQPSILVEKPSNGKEGPWSWSNSLNLPRGDLILFGGDLAYPSPTDQTYEQRFFRPYEYAMPPPEDYDKRAVSISKPRNAPPADAPDCPQMFAVPGNHDWIDGLDTFMRNICQRDWIGGWSLPQDRSYFAIQLPHGWWVFGLDLGLRNDLDVHQYQYFCHVTLKLLQPNDRVILVSHRPSWVLDELDEIETEQRLSHLEEVILKGRVAIRLAGDIHHYSRMMPIGTWPSSRSKDVTSRRRPAAAARRRSSGSNFFDLFDFSPKSKLFAGLGKLGLGQPATDAMLDQTEGTNRFPGNTVRQLFVWTLLALPAMVVSGGAGAFAHPTHNFRNTSTFRGDKFMRTAVYPSLGQSRAMSFKTLFSFRYKNWRFDMFGGTLYFCLMFSVFPICRVSTVLTSKTFFGFAWAVIRLMMTLHYEIWSESYASMLALLLMSIGVVFFVDSRNAGKRLVIGFLHALAHANTAMVLMILLEGILASGTHHGVLIAPSIWKSAAETWPRLFPYLQALNNSSYGMLEWLSNVMGTVLDVPHMTASFRQQICLKGFSSLTRFQTLWYYAGALAYYWVLATPAVSFVFGAYLYIASTFAGGAAHFNESFSALRIQDYKNFLRMHITKTGTLEVYSIGVDHVPRHWVRDPAWGGLFRRRRPDSQLSTDKMTESINSDLLGKSRESKTTPPPPLVLSDVITSGVPNQLSRSKSVSDLAPVSRADHSDDEEDATGAETVEVKNGEEGSAIATSSSPKKRRSKKKKNKSNLSTASTTAATTTSKSNGTATSSTTKTKTNSTTASSQQRPAASLTASKAVPGELSESDGESSRSSLSSIDGSPRNGDSRRRKRKNSINLSSLLRHFTPKLILPDASLEESSSLEPPSSADPSPLIGSVPNSPELPQTVATPSSSSKRQSDSSLKSSNSTGAPNQTRTRDEPASPPVTRPRRGSSSSVFELLAYVGRKILPDDFDFSGRLLRKMKDTYARKRVEFLDLDLGTLFSSMLPLEKLKRVRKLQADGQAQAANGRSASLSYRGKLQYSETVPAYSHLWSNPSRWIAAVGEPFDQCKVIDHFTVLPINPTPDDDTTSIPLPRKSAEV